jgi:hypothetical protein
MLVMGRVMKWELAPLGLPLGLRLTIIEILC